MAWWPEDTRRAAMFWGAITLAGVVCFSVAYWYGMRIGNRIAAGAVPVKKITEQRSAVSKFAYRAVDQDFRVRVPRGEEIPLEPRITIVTEAAGAVDLEEARGPWGYTVEEEKPEEDEAIAEAAEDLLSRAGWSREPVAARRFSVDAGRYENEQEMREAAQRFRERGYPVFIEEERRGGKVRYQLRIGAFERNSDAQTVRQELGRSGLIPGSGPATPAPSPPAAPSTPMAPSPPAPAEEEPAPTPEVQPAVPGPQPSEAPADARPIEDL